MSEREFIPPPAAVLRRRLDAPLLRRAFGQFGTGVAIIGTRASDGSLVGMTVNSFASISMDPPLVMYCPAKALSAYAVYAGARHFSASVLAVEQQSLSERFAKKGERKWAGVAHILGETGVPLLDEAIVCFECETVAIHDAGDHGLVLGRVLALRVAGAGEPLLFHRSRYCHLAQDATDVDAPAAALAWGL
ncbi:MAG: flavin reductase family protein [Burkholderiaceae bacterium]